MATDIGREVGKSSLLAVTGDHPIRFEQMREKVYNLEVFEYFKNFGVLFDTFTALTTDPRVGREFIKSGRYDNCVAIAPYINDPTKTIGILYQGGTVFSQVPGVFLAIFDSGIESLRARLPDGLEYHNYINDLGSKMCHDPSLEKLMSVVEAQFKKRAAALKSCEEGDKS